MSKKDLVKRSMIRITQILEQKNLCKSAGLVLTIHDELLFEVPEGEIAEVCKIIKHEMENVCSLDVPLKVQVKMGKKWGSMALCSL